MEKLKHTADYSSSRTICQDIVRSVFKKAEVRKIRVLTGGIVNRNFEMRLINPNMQVHLKVYSGKDAEDRASKERIVYDLLAKQTDIPISTIYASNFSRTVANEAFVLQSSLPGANLEVVCNELSLDERKSIALQVGECLGQLHTICFTRFGDKLFENAIGDKLSWSIP